MNGKRQLSHPFAKVDLAQLDENFLELVEHTCAQDGSDAGTLTQRKKQLFAPLKGVSVWQTLPAFWLELKTCLQRISIVEFVEVRLC